jgi:cytochrome c oxidase subunit III
MTAAAKPISRGVWGMWMMILTELMIFGSLIGSFFFVHAYRDAEPMDLTRIAAFSVVLLGSSVPMAWAERGLRRDNIGQLQAGLGIALVMGAVFFANQVAEYRELEFDWQDDVFGSLFFAITGLHGAHLLMGLVMGAVVLAKAPKRPHRTMEVVALYWHFVDFVWVLVFSTVYLSPHLL